MRHLLALLIGIVCVSANAVGSWAQEIVRFPATEPNEPGGVQLRGELWRPTGTGPFPAVVLMHGCSGWQPAARYALRGYAADLQQQGFAVLNLDSFGSRYYNGDEMCASNAKLRRALAYRTSDAFDAARYLRAQSFVDGANIFLMGQSNGGSVVLRAAQAGVQESYRRKFGDPGFRGVVAFYPWCGEVTGGVAFAAPVQVFAGGRDNWVSAQECSDVRASGARYDVMVYPQAAHSFDLEVIAHNYMGFLVGRDPSAAADSRQRMHDFLRNNLTVGGRSLLQAGR